jgi:hypothetical protein
MSGDLKNGNPEKKSTEDDVNLELGDKNRRSHVERIEDLRERLNKHLGLRFWKNYSTSCFWSNFATPLNLCITVATALTAAQASTKDGLLSHKAYVDITVFTLILSTLNTFFRPHSQMSEALDQLNEWNKFGLKFEALYYGIDGLTDAETLKELHKLQTEVNQFENSTPQKNSFLTDTIHALSRYMCLRGREGWITEGRTEKHNSPK